MLKKSLDEIVSVRSLSKAFDHINPNSHGIDGITYEEFAKNKIIHLTRLNNEILSGHYVPEPMRKIEITKESSNGKRPLSISSIKDKIVQSALRFHLSNYFERFFSDSSFAYRQGRNHIAALDRVKTFLDQNYSWVLKSDIHDFFESISHEILVKMLTIKIEDQRIVHLISLLIQNGGFLKNTYYNHYLGIHQGDSLSPMLSNVYLDPMDKYLEQQGIAFVRYADDFVILCRSKEDCIHSKAQLQVFLWEALSLRLSDEKTFISSIDEGFAFLGARFVGIDRIIDQSRLEKSIDKLHRLALRKEPFGNFAEAVGKTVETLKRYYVQIVGSNSKQIWQLQNAIMQSCEEKIVSKHHHHQSVTKGEVRASLSSIDLTLGDLDSKQSGIVDLIIANAWAKIAAQTLLKSSAAPINRKKERYSKQLTATSHLHITRPGVVLGMAKNQFTIKESGKVIKAIPKNKITHIIIAADGVSLSSHLIHECAASKIPIDFIDKNSLPYASLVTFNASLSHNALRQLEIIQQGKSIEIAREFIRGKGKNQINYLKYLNKYHKHLAIPITTMEKTLKKIYQATNSNELMGYEGEISALYWSALESIVDEKFGFSARVTYGADDVINSSLNYGYAILYGKIRYALIKAGLSLHISFLHAHDENKPTLVFDMIEEFRAFVVDRVIISMANKHEPLSVGKDGRLTDETKKLIAKNIFDRLGSYTTWHKEQHKIEEMIFNQAYLLARTIRGEAKYTPFIGKF